MAKAKYNYKANARGIRMATTRAKWNNNNKNNNKGQNNDNNVKTITRANKRPGTWKRTRARAWYVTKQ